MLLESSVQLDLNIMPNRNQQTSHACQRSYLNELKASSPSRNNNDTNMWKTQQAWSPNEKEKISPSRSTQCDIPLDFSFMNVEKQSSSPTQTKKSKSPYEQKVLYQSKDTNRETNRSTRISTRIIRPNSAIKNTRRTEIYAQQAEERQYKQFLV